MPEFPVRRAVPAVLPAEPRPRRPKAQHSRGDAPHPCARLSGGDTCCGGCRERLAERAAQADADA